MRHFSYMFSFLFLVVYATNLQAQDPTIGLIQFSEAAQEGYTLISPPGKITYLIDNCGQEINRWESDYNIAGRAHMREDGSLLRSAKDVNTTITLGGEAGILELFDWEGNLLWQYFYSGTDFVSHHDMTAMPNGNILIMAVEVITANEALLLGRDPNLLQEELYIETVVELEPIGTNQAEVVWKWNVSDHLIQDYSVLSANFGVIAEHPELIDINFAPNGFGADWLHFNGLDYNAELDQITFSSRATDEIYIIDHSTTTDEAASHEGGNSGKGGDFLYRWGNPITYDRGTAADRKLFGPHDVNWIKEGFPNAGELLVFNNGNNRPGGQYSTIDRIIPPLDNEGNYDLAMNDKYLPDAANIAFEANPSNSFFASNISGAEQLINGNYLICNGPRGILFEVNDTGETVWEYINPVTNDGPQAQGSVFPLIGNQLFSVTRYMTNFVGFENLELTSGSVLESEPYDSDCTLISTNINQTDKNKLLLSPNPVHSELKISNLESDNISIKVIDLQGKTHLNRTFNSPNPTLNLHHIPHGLYFIQVQTDANSKIQVYRFIRH